MPIPKTPALRIKRPLTSSSVFGQSVDLTIKKHLDELDQLLGKRVFAPPAAPVKGVVSSNSRGLPVDAFLKLPVTPKQVASSQGRQGQQKGGWAKQSAAAILSATNPQDRFITLSEFIDGTAQLVDLKYEFQEELAQSKLLQDFNTRVILESYPNICDYLITYAYEILTLKNVNAIRNFVGKHVKGGKAFIDYAVISAARTLIDKEQLEVQGLNDDGGELAGALRKAKISFGSTFETSASAVIDNFVFNSDELDLIENSKVGPIPAEIKPLLVKYIQSSTIPLDQNNIDFYLPLFVTQALQSQGQQTDPDDTFLDVPDQDFNVQFVDEQDAGVSDVSKPAIRCAAQLYHGMVVGDELDVFGIMNYFTHKYLLRGGLEIQNKRLRADIRLYVFSEKFIDLQVHKVLDRTRPAERQMFYRQVFNEGSADITEDVIVNPDFKRLWKVMILESAKFLQRAQTSYNLDLVSRQNVAQAVEDLQYNLSTNCTGMVNVIAPLIDAELNFVLTRILKHPEIVQYVTPSGGNWQRVIEKLSSEMKRTRPRATTLYNKAKFGEKIMRSIAAYTPGTFDQYNDDFSDFISLVEAFITTQSILQESIVEKLVNEDTEADAAADESEDYSDDSYEPGQTTRNGNSSNGAVLNGSSANGASRNGSAAGNEWDF